MAVMSPSPAVHFALCTIRLQKQYDHFNWEQIVNSNKGETCDHSRNAKQDEGIELQLNQVQHIPLSVSTHPGVI